MKFIVLQILMNKNKRVNAKNELNIKKICLAFSKNSYSKYLRQLGCQSSNSLSPKFDHSSIPP